MCVCCQYVVSGQYVCVCVCACAHAHNAVGVRVISVYG